MATVPWMSPLDSSASPSVKTRKPLVGASGLMAEVCAAAPPARANRSALASRARPPSSAPKEPDLLTIRAL